MEAPILQQLRKQVVAAYEAWQDLPWQNDGEKEKAYAKWQDLIAKSAQEQARIWRSIVRPNAEPRAEINDTERATKIAAGIVMTYGEAGCGHGDAAWSGGYQKYGYSRRGVEALESGRVPYSKLPAALKRVANLDREKTATEWHHVGTPRHGYKRVYMYDPAVLELARREIIRQGCQQAIAPVKKERAAA